MTRFERFILKNVFRKAVIQCPDHNVRIAELYKMIHDAARAEFSEDNTVTLNAFLQEQFELSLK